MPERGWKFRVHDIIEAIDKITQYITTASTALWIDDAKTVDAVIRNLEIIGEAASRIPLETQQKHQDIPWQLMKDMRNILAHEYFGVDLGIIERTVHEDLQKLRATVSATIK